MKRILVWLLVVMLAVANVSVAFAADYSLDTAKSSVVRVAVYFEVEPEYRDVVHPACRTEMLSTGSAFAVGEYGSTKVQYFVTAAHVTMHNDPQNPTATTALLPLANGEEAYVPVKINAMRILINDVNSFVNALYVGCSDRADVAVISTTDPISVRKPAVLIDTQEFGANSTVTAMGFPAVADANFSINATDLLLATTENVSTNTGYVSRVARHEATGEGDQIQTTAAMNHGISGGALVDQNGYVIGVCTSGAVGDNNTNYASATSEIIRLLNSLRVKYTAGPLKNDTTLYVIIGVAAAVIIVLVVLIVVNANGKNSKRELVFSGVMNGKTVPLKKGKPVCVGRDPARCTVIYPKDTAGVSGLHCTITFDGKAVQVADNGSSFGTFVGGSKVEPGRPVVMHRGQEITFGGSSQSAVLH